MVTSIGYGMQRSSVPIRQNPNQWIANIILVIIHTLYWLLLPATNHSLWGKSFVVDDYYPDKNLIFDHKSPQARSSFSSIAISDPISQVLLVNLQQNPHSHHDSLAKQVPLKHSHVCSGSFAVLMEIANKWSTWQGSIEYVTVGTLLRRAVSDITLEWLGCSNPLVDVTGMMADIGESSPNGWPNFVIRIHFYIFMYWLLVWNMNFMTFHLLGISSSQLTNSMIFQRARYTTNQI